VLMVGCAVRQKRGESAASSTNSPDAFKVAVL
jgi:hypothetical protein